MTLFVDVCALIGNTTGSPYLHRNLQIVCELSINSSAPKAKAQRVVAEAENTIVSPLRKMVSVSLLPFLKDVEYFAVDGHVLSFALSVTPIEGKRLIKNQRWSPSFLFPQ